MIEASIEYLFILWTRVEAAFFTTLIAPCFFSLGKKSKIIPPFRFGNLCQIQIGTNVTIHSNCWIQVLRSHRPEISPKLIIKDYVSIGMDSSISAAEKIVIEENVFTGRNVYISDHGHEFHDVTRPISDQGIRKICEVKIGSSTWLGQNSIILPGVKIGKHCIIGANSVVNQSIPDYSVAVGAPAHVIKQYNASSKKWEKYPFPK